jgi:tetratricopeptide (TPR) repeat protein
MRKRIDAGSAVGLAVLGLGLSLGCESRPAADPPETPSAFGTAEQTTTVPRQVSRSPHPSQKETESNRERLLSPPNHGEDTLVDVPLPDLRLLGVEVQQQLRQAQESLVAVCREPGVTSDSLSVGYGEMGRLYHAYDLLDSAEACYRNARALAPNEFRWVYLLADVRRWQGNVDQSIAAFEAALELNPDYVPALVALGEIRLEVGQMDQALPLFERAVMLQPNSAALVGLGKIAASQKEFDKAVRHFEAALAQQPSATAVHYPLAMAYRGKGDLENAQAHALQRGDTRARVADPLLDQLVELRTGAEHHEKRGVAAGEAGDLDRAVIELQAAVEANPESSSARLNLGTALAQSGDREGALRQYREAVRLDPKSAQAHLNLAVMLANGVDRDGAIDHFRQAVSLDPEYRTAHLGLAELLAQAGDHATAAVHFGRVVEIDPRHRAARLGQAVSLSRAGRQAEACQRLTQALNVLPEDAVLTHALARLLAACPDDELRDGPRALDLALSAFEKRNLPQYAETVAMAYAESGNFAEAVRWQNEVVQGAEKAGRDDLLPRARRLLTRYHNQQPCRDPFPFSAASVPETPSQ